MATELPSENILPVRWTDVLDRVAQALAQTEAEAARAEQILTAEPASDAAHGWQDALVRLGERLQHLDACIAQAGHTAADVEAALQGSESALRRWLAEAEAVRGRLANGATSAVS
jgi:hypothetical protein